jgi:hypothetical protein
VEGWSRVQREAGIIRVPPPPPPPDTEQPHTPHYATGLGPPKSPKF